MKLSTKLTICNVIFCIIVAVVALTGLFYVVDIDGADYTITYTELLSVRQIFTDIRTSSDPELEAIEIAEYKLKEKGYSYFFYSADGKVDTNSDKEYERALAEKYSFSTSEQSVIQVDGAFITSMAFTSGRLVAIDSSDYVGANRKTKYYIYLVSVILSSICMIIAITVAERVMLVPRLKALNQAMNEVFRGNYERVMEVDSKGSDELAVICAEFDMLRKKLGDSEKEKEAFDRERGLMISGISHDLRTPLSVIQGYSKGIKDGVAKKIGKEEEYIEKIYSTSLSMNGLIDKLSAFAKMQSREVMYTFQEQDLCDVIDDFIHKNYIQYSARGIEINGTVPSSPRLIVNLDKVQFDRILQNICDNSLKYKTAPTANMNIKVVDQGDVADIYLSDDGPGVRDFEADYIFENYYRGDPSRTNPVSGSGLGLSIVKNIVHAHKGEVVAYNDNGLTIKITIPIRRKK